MIAMAGIPTTQAIASMISRIYNPTNGSLTEAL